MSSQLNRYFFDRSPAVYSDAMRVDRPEGRPRLTPPRVGLRDSATWLHWLDEAFRHTPSRMWHSRGVWHAAVSARRHELRWLADERMATLELAALLHDVGRALDPHDTEPHAFVGARFLDSVGLDDVAALVAHHSGALLEAEHRGMTHLDVWSPDPELVAVLTYFDRTTSEHGVPVTFEERRSSLIARYGVDAPQVRWFDSTLPAAREGARLLQRRTPALVA